MKRPMKVDALRPCPTCGKPRPYRLSLCWACYRLARPDWYAAKLIYNRERSQRKRAVA